LLVYGALAADLKPLSDFAAQSQDLEIVSPCVPGRPWTVAGEHGALLGRQNGKFEAWQWPVKILSDFRIRAELADYAVPIDVNALAASEFLPRKQSLRIRTPRSRYASTCSRGADRTLPYPPQSSLKSILFAR
jgi:hypothetical protein